MRRYDLDPVENKAAREGVTAPPIRYLECLDGLYLPTVLLFLALSFNMAASWLPSSGLPAGSALFGLTLLFFIIEPVGPPSGVG